MPKPIDKIVKRARKVICIESLIDCWNDIAWNKYKYTLDELNSARKTIAKLALNKSGSEEKKKNFHDTLNKMGETI